MTITWRKMVPKWYVYSLLCVLDVNPQSERRRNDIGAELPHRKIPKDSIGDTNSKYLRTYLKSSTRWPIVRSAIKHNKSTATSNWSIFRLVDRFFMMDPLNKYLISKHIFDIFHSQKFHFLLKIWTSKFSQRNFTASYSVVSSLVSLICGNLISGVNPYSTQVNLTRKVSIQNPTHLHHAITRLRVIDLLCN